MTAGTAIATVLPPLARLVADIGSGKIHSVEDALRSLAGEIIAIAPDGEMHQYLTDASRKRAELAADLLEQKKFGDEQ